MKKFACAALAAALLAPSAPIAQDAAEQPEETEAQRAARELCTETAQPDAWPGWNIQEGKTCQNSFANVCTIIRASDKAEASYTCYEPLEEETEESQ